MRLRDTRGQATVEFALIIPLVLVAILAMVQIAVIATAQLGAVHTAREVARALSVDPHADIGNLADKTALLGNEGLRIEARFLPSQTGSRETVCVNVVYKVRPISRMFSVFMVNFEVQATAKMVVET